MLLVSALLKKIFFKKYIDFNLKVGDTVPGYTGRWCTSYPDTVVSVDSILI